MYYNPNYIEWGTNQGWRCPGCGRYYSPSTPMCFYCGGNQKTWTSPSTTGVPNDNGWWKDYMTISTADSAAAAGIKQEVKTGTVQATTTTDKNVVITAKNSDYTVTCKHSCGKCDKYNESCFGGIETTSSGTIISHRKPPKVTYDFIEEDILDSFIKHFQN